MAVIRKTIVLLLCLLFSAVCISPAGAAVPASGTCGENAAWSLGEDGVLTISGSGPMDDYSYMTDTTNAPWGSAAAGISAIVIEDGVTAIGSCAFKGCKTVREVRIPASVIRIGDSAFYECKALESVIIPKANCAIGTEVFANCTGLRSAALPSGLESIGERTFWLCTSLTRVIVPAGVEAIGPYAFYRCTALRELCFAGGSVASIDTTAFIGVSGMTVLASVDSGYPLEWAVKNALQTVLLDNPSTTVVLPAGTRTVGKDALYGTGAVTYIIPNHCEAIASGAFAGLPSARLIEIPASVLEIPNSAFAGSDIMIRTPVGSFAEQYALAHGIPLLR